MLAVHGAALWGLWTQHPIPTPRETVTLFVDLIAPPTPPKVESAPKRELSRLRRDPHPPPRQLLVEGAITSPGEVVAPASLPAPPPMQAIAAPPEPKPVAGPLTLGTELAASCPERTAPNYPILSRRMSETGIVVLRVELDELGQVSAARVATGSGFARLDEAALGIVKTWRCTPAQRNGEAVRAVALQPFKFELRGN